jgi:hypothetical protein
MHCLGCKESHYDCFSTIKVAWEKLITTRKEHKCPHGDTIPKGSKVLARKVYPSYLGVCTIKAPEVVYYSNWCGECTH